MTNQNTNKWRHVNSEISSWLTSGSVVFLFVWMSIFPIFTSLQTDTKASSRASPALNMETPHNYMDETKKVIENHVAQEKKHLICSNKFLQLQSIFWMIKFILMHYKNNLGTVWTILIWNSPKLIDFLKFIYHLIFIQYYSVYHWHGFISCSLKKSKTKKGSSKLDLRKYARVGDWKRDSYRSTEVHPFVRFFFWSCTFYRLHVFKIIYISII